MSISIKYKKSLYFPCHNTELYNNLSSFEVAVDIFAGDIEIKNNGIEIFGAKEISILMLSIDILNSYFSMMLNNSYSKKLVRLDETDCDLIMVKNSEGIYFASFRDGPENGILNYLISPEDIIYIIVVLKKMLSEIPESESAIKKLLDYQIIQWLLSYKL